MRVHEQVIEAGERDVGRTVHFVVPELDAGPMIAQAACRCIPATRRKRWRRACWTWSTGSIPQRCRLAGGRQSETGKRPGGLFLTP